MATKDQIIQEINFGLFQLSAKNAQHEFEHLCRHLTRKRICSNIIPATGPVQAGGDQGRDFETFHTYLKNSPIADSSFIGLASDKPIAFACSLQKTPEAKSGKIQSDVKTIVSTGTEVDRVYFFSSRDIDISKQHELKNWAKETYSVSLEILDAQVISELLAEPDVFWIANRYLSIPSEIYPRPINEEDWYKELIEEYKKRESISLTFEEFTEIKIAGRHIYKTSNLKHDLSFWIRRLEHFISNNVFPRIKREAIYEVFVLSFIGLGNVSEYDSIIREYFSQLDNTVDICELEDAVCLVSFATTATNLNQLSLTEEELSSWREAVNVIVETRLKTTKDPNTRCSLLAIKAESNIIAPRNILDYQRNFKIAINLFHELLNHISQAPFYPLERLSYKLTKYIEKFLKSNIPVNIDEFEELAERVDKLFAKRSSAFKIADKLGDRAVLYLDNDQIVKAIRILHQAKEKYFADEAIEGAILMLLLTSNSYGRLKMNLAGKYYALIAFHLVMNYGKLELSKYISQAICKAASIDYKNGSWISFLDLIGPALLLGSYTLKDYIEKHPQVDEIIYHLAVIKYVTERLAPNLNHLINFQVNKWHFLREYVETLSTEAKRNFDPMSTEELWQSFEEQLDYKPFNDVGDTRSISWEAFGITWELRFINGYSTNPIAEQFGAVLQILLIELADTELYLTKGIVKIKIIQTDNERPSCKQKPSNKERLWEVRLPKLDNEDKETIEEFQRHYIVFAIAILYELSLLPSEAFKDVIAKSYENGLKSKIMFILPYASLYKKYVSEEKFNESQRNKFLNPLQAKLFRLSCEKSLSWKNGIAPIYDYNKNIECISNRYKNSLELVEITLEQLNQLPEFQETVEYFRNKGWLDWHILITVTNIALFHKARLNKKNATHFQEVQQEFMRLYQIPEKDNHAPLPLHIFNKENIEWQFNLGILSVLNSYGLEYHGVEAPNIEAIKELLIQRFNFLTDDVKHENPFQV